MYCVRRFDPFQKNLFQKVSGHTEKNHLKIGNFGVENNCYEIIMILESAELSMIN